MYCIVYGSNKTILLLLLLQLFQPDEYESHSFNESIRPDTTGLCEFIHPDTTCLSESFHPDTTGLWESIHPDTTGLCESFHPDTTCLCESFLKMPAYNDFVLCLS